jgi:hypothetical protein
VKIDLMLKKKSKSREICSGFWLGIKFIVFIVYINWIEIGEYQIARGDGKFIIPLIYLPVAVFG